MKVRFGMLMTDAVGKAGGQCIQRFRGTRVLRNITQPVQRLASLKNRQRITLASLSQYWYSISDAHRNNWSLAAGRYPRTDTFGETKYFTGRQMFFALNGVNLDNYTWISDPSNLTLQASVIEVSTVSLKISTSTLELDGVSNSNANYFQIRFVQLRSKISNLDVRKMKQIFITEDPTNANDMFMKLVETFGYPKAGLYYGFAIRSASSEGITSPWQVFKIRCDN